MPTYLTGRERDLTFAGAFQGSIAGDFYALPLPPHWNRYTTQHAAAGLLLSVDAQGSVANLSYTTTIPWSQTLTVTLGALLPSGGTSGTASTAGTVSSPGPLSISGQGSFSVTVPLQECVTIDISGTPTYGGPGVLDHPAYTPCRFYERPKVGATASCQVVYSGMTVALTKVFGTADGTVVISDNGQVGAQVWDYLKAGTAITSGTIGGYSVVVPVSGSNSYGSFDTSSYAQAVSVGSAAHVTADARRWIPRNYRLDGIIRDLAGTPYPNPVDCVWTPRGSAENLTISSGTIGTAWTAERYVAGGFAGVYGAETGIGSASLNQHGSVTCYVATAWLGSASEDTSDWRMLQRGIYYPAFTLLDSGTVVIDGGFSHTGGGTTARAYGTAKVLNTHRYLDWWTDRASDNTFSVRIGTKTFAGSTDATGRMRIDLCGPINGTATADYMCSRYPVPTADDVLGSPGCYWGVTQTGTISLVGGSTGSIAVGTVALVRQGRGSEITFAPEFRRFHQRYIAGGGSVHRLAVVNVDGKRGLEIIDGYAGADISVGSAGTLINQIGTATWDSGATVWPGWTFELDPTYDVADGSAFTDWGTAFLNKNRPASWIAGREMFRSGTVWTQYRDIDPFQVIAFPVQVLVDSIEVYGGAGDCWGQVGTAYGTASHPVDVAHIFRGVADGITYGTPGTVAAGVTVNLRQTSGGAARGSGVSGTAGYYLTGSPGGEGQVQHDTYAGVGGTVTRTIYARGRHRAVLMAQLAVDWPTYDTTISQRHLRGYLIGSAYYAGYAGNVEANSWSDGVTALTIGEPCVRMDRSSQDQRLWLAYRQGTSVLLANSVDEGSTWSVAGTVAASGSYPEIVVTRDGRRCCYWYDGGTISGRIYDGAGTAMVGPFVVVNGGAAEKFAVAEHIVGVGGWRMHMIYRTTGGALVDLESTDGTAFA